DARGGRRGGVLRARRRHRSGRRAPRGPLTGWGLPQLTSSYPARYGRAGLVSEQVDPMGGPTAITLADTSTLDQCPVLPPQGQGAEENAQWWSGLSAAEQDYFIAANPQIGGMDGLPAEVRHEANMATLRNDAASGHDQAGAQALLDRIESSQGGPAGERIFLLDYEPPGRDGNPDAKVVAAIGNPDTADNVAIYVPGTGSDLSNVGGSIDRMDDLRAEAEMVPGSGDTSTIVWLGY